MHDNQKLTQNPMHDESEVVLAMLTHAAWPVSQKPSL